MEYDDETEKLKRKIAQLEKKLAEVEDASERARDYQEIWNLMSRRQHLLAAEQDQASGGVFNIGTGDSIEINSLWRRIAYLAECDKQPNHALPRPGDIVHSLADIQSAQEKMGFSPKVPLKQGLAETYAWYKQQG